MLSGDEQTNCKCPSCFLEAFPLAPFVARMRRYLVGGRFLLLEADLGLL